MALTTVDQGLLSTNAQWAAFKNKLFNPQFLIWQKGTTFTGAKYGADRWYSDQVGCTIARSTDVPTGIGAVYSAYCTNSGGTSVILQRIENTNCYDLVGQQVTISFYCKAASGTPTLNCDVRYPNSTNSFTAGQTIIQSQGVTLSTGWVKYTLTFNALPTNVSTGLQVTFYSSGNFYFTFPQLERGVTATSFDYRDYGREQQLCFRYWFRYSAVNAAYAEICVINWFSSTRALGSIYFPVALRGLPAVTNNLYQLWFGANPQGVPTSIGISTSTYAADATYAIGFDAAIASGAAASGSCGQLKAVNNSASYMDFDAEIY